MELVVRNGDLQFDGSELMVTNDLVYRQQQILHNLFQTERGELALTPNFGIDRYQIFDYVHGVRPSQQQPYVLKVITDQLQNFVSGNEMMNIELEPDDLHGLLNVRITFTYYDQEFEVMSQHISVEQNDVTSLINF